MRLSDGVFFSQFTNVSGGELSANTIVQALNLGPLMAVLEGTCLVSLELEPRLAPTYMSK